MSEVTIVDVSSRWMYYVQWDDVVLFQKYLTVFGTPPAYISRHYMTEVIVRFEVGDEIVDKYIAEVRKWDEFERVATEQWMKETEE